MTRAVVERNLRERSADTRMSLLCIPWPSASALSHSRSVNYHVSTTSVQSGSNAPLRYNFSTLPPPQTGDKYMKLRVYYTEGTPDDYRPPGFLPLEGEEGDVWTMGTKRIDVQPLTEILGRVDAGHHR